MSYLNQGVFGNLEWVEKRSLNEGAQAFDDLHNGKSPPAKILLKPN